MCISQSCCQISAEPRSQKTCYSVTQQLFENNLVTSGSWSEGRCWEWCLICLFHIHMLDTLYITFNRTIVIVMVMMVFIASLSLLLASTLSPSLSSSLSPPSSSSSSLSSSSYHPELINKKDKSVKCYFFYFFSGVLHSILKVILCSVEHKIPCECMAGSLSDVMIVFLLHGEKLLTLQLPQANW